MSIEPLFNYVIVDKDKEVEQTKGGIYIPDNAQEKPSTGTVVAVGPGVYAEQSGAFIPTNVNVGDRVLFLRLGGHEVEIDGETYSLLKETELLGKIH